MSELQVPGVAGRRVIVTGAAGALGLAVARCLVAAGARVGAAYRGAAPDLPGGIAAAAFDLDDEAAVASGFARLTAGLGGPAQLLVHCAGGYADAPLPATSLELWRRMLEGNLTAAFLCIRAVLPAMCAAGHGRIVTVGSRAGLHGGEDVAAYSASKGGLLRLTEAAAAEGLPFGVTANCVLPGTINTPSNRAALPGADVGRWVSPEAIADVCLFLCSDTAAPISGAAIPVFGRS